MTIVAPSWYGEVSITDRGWPLLRPVVVSSSTGIRPAFHPSRPKLTASTVRWMVFMAFRARSLGMGRP